MTTINVVKKSGEEFLLSVSRENQTILVFANLGLNTITNSGSERQFIQHVGAFSPAQNNGQFYKALVGPELLEQMKEKKDTLL